MTERSERREEIKLNLEYLKLPTSAVGLFLIVLAVLQWKAANINAMQAVYQHMTKEWSDHLKMFVAKPALRPYFADSAPLPSDDNLRQEVLAMAAVRLDAMDAVLTFAGIQGQSENIAGWRNTFSSAFRHSVVLCDLVRATEAEYGLIVPISQKACVVKL